MAPVAELGRRSARPKLGPSLAFIGFVQPASGGILSMSETQACALCSEHGTARESHFSALRQYRC